MSDSPGGGKNAGGVEEARRTKGKVADLGGGGVSPRLIKSSEIWIQLMQTALFQSKTV